MRPKRAVALRYEHQRDAAPRVVAKGAGEVAEAIIRMADDASVKVLEDKSLVDSLIHLELDSVIPEELYTVVAEVLAIVYKDKR